MNVEWYPFYVRDFRRDTQHLTAAQEGVYRRLIDEYMTTQEALPDSDAALARIAGPEWLEVAPVVRLFFHSQNGKLVHKRCEKELDAQAMRTQCKRMKAKASANARWDTFRKMKGLDANAVQAQCDSNADAMRIDTTKKERYKKEGQPSEEQKTSISPQLQEVMARKGWTNGR